MKYVYTELGESRAKELGFTDRKAGEIAFCGMEPVTGTTAKAWEAKGYVKAEGCWGLEPGEIVIFKEH